MLIPLLRGNRISTVLALDHPLHIDGTLTARNDVLDAVLDIDATQPKATRRKRRPSRLADTIEVLTNAMHEHLKAARDHAHSFKQQRDTPKLLPQPAEQELAALVGISPSTVNHCLNKDLNAKQLQVCWMIASDWAQVMAYRR